MVDVADFVTSVDPWYASLLDKVQSSPENIPAVPGRKWAIV